MRYLITGGAGFIGSHLADQLVGRGQQVTILDNLVTGRYENIASLEQNSRVTFIKDSVLSTSLVQELVRESEAVFHLASAVGVRLIMERPVETIESIFEGTAVVLQACARYRRPFLLTSTSEVYGKSEVVPFVEDGDRLEGPTDKHRWAYATAKALDEFLALAHWKESRLPVIVLRLFNTVGPRQSGQYGMVLPNFIQRSLNGEDILVHGDGQQSRCFCHVTDIVDGLIKLMHCDNARGQVINLGSQEEISIIDLADRVISRTGSSSKLRLIPYDQVYGADFEDMRRRIPSTAKALRLVGWRPTHSLDQIIDDVAQDLRERSPAFLGN